MPEIIPHIRSIDKVTIAVIEKIAMSVLFDKNISRIVALLKIRKLVPINTPAIAAVGISANIGAKNTVINNKITL